MLFYLDAKGQTIQEFLADNGEYIGMLGNAEGDNITPNDIAIEKINQHKDEKDQFLVCCILNGAWWVGILFNTKLGAAEIRRYKGKPMLFYWVKREDVKSCLGHMHQKEFDILFPIPKEA